MPIKEAVAKARDFFENPMKYARSPGCPPVNGGSLYVEIQSLQEILDLHELGSGCFGTVFDLDCANVVLKISKDDAYRAWTNYIRVKNGTNPYLPRLHYRTTVGQYDICVLEKLMDWDYIDHQPTIDFCRSFPSIIKGISTGFADVLCPKLKEVITEFGAINLNDASGPNIRVRENPDGTYQAVLSDPTSRYEGGTRRSFL